MREMDLFSRIVPPETLWDTCKCPEITASAGT